MLIRAVSVTAVSATAVSVGAVSSVRRVATSVGQIATVPVNPGRWYSGEFAGRRIETGAAKFPAVGT
jgi:hypothetical protein